MSTLAIVGSGLAGYTLAREFRKIDKETSVTLISQDSADFYSKPMLSTALAQGKDAQSLVMTPAEKMSSQLNIKLHANTQVMEINRQNRQCVFTDGKAVDYEKLVLAVGAEPIRIPFEGNASDDMLSINHLDDYALFRKKLTDKVKRVAIVGAGLIGCEFANDLASQGIKVDVIGLGETPLDTLIPAEAGKNLQAALEQQGVVWHLETTIDQLDRAEKGYKITLKNGDSFTADLVLSAIGLRSNIALAKAAELTCNRGIVVNDLMQTNDEFIYALGDCAEINGQVLPYVMPIMHSARALAKTITGEPTSVSYPIMPVIVKTSQHPVVLAGSLTGEGINTKTIAIEQGVKLEAIDLDGKLVGFCLVGEAANKEKQALLAKLSKSAA